MAGGSDAGRRGGLRGALGSILADTRPLRIPAFRRLWISTAITSIGSQLTIVAVPKQIFDITGSSGWVGVSGAVALVPLLLFGLWGGAIADTVDRRKLILVTNVGIAVTSGLLWSQAFAELGSVWPVFGLLAVNQAFFAINLPTRTAVVARLVPAELLPSAVALNSTTGLLGAVLGPMLAGALIPLLGLSTLYAVDVVALTLALIAIRRLPALPPLYGPSRRAGMRDVVDGFRYLSTKRVLLASFVLDIIAMVAGMPRALFPQMAEQTFGDPAGGGLALGWLYAAMPLGALVSGVFSGWFTRINRHGVAITLAVCAWGVAVVGFGLAGSLWLALVCLAFGGVADFVSMAFRNTILQQSTTDEMRGRLQGVFVVVVSGGPRIADVVHGWAGAAAGTATAVTAGGVLVVVGTLFAVAMLPAFWRYRAAVEPVAQPQAGG